MNILIIEDNESDIFIMNLILNEAINDIQYKIIKNGKEAITFIKLNTYIPDLIILDYDLPCYNGIQILEELRQFNKLVPVVIFSASDLLECKEDIIRLGAVYTQKPMNYQDYSMKVKSFLDLIKIQPQNEIA